MVAGIDCRRVTLACRRTRLLRSRGSWLLFLQLSTARWMSPRLPRRAGFSSAKAHPTVLHSVSYTSRFPRYWSFWQQARGYTQFSVLKSWLRLSTLIDSTSQRIVYSIFTRSREYSNAIHCTPVLSCRTTSGVVAGMGPGAALELAPRGEPCCAEPGCRLWFAGLGCGGLSIDRCGLDCGKESIFIAGLVEARAGVCDV